MTPYDGISDEPARIRSTFDYVNCVPVHVVWEITSACDLKCQHCGSRAGKRRPNELSTEECLSVVDQLAHLGTRELTLIGGEAYLRKDWTKIIARARKYNIYCAVQTGGRNLNQERLADAVKAGLQGVGVSLDGLESLHDVVRGVPGSFRQAVDLLQRAKNEGLATSVNTQIGKGTIKQLNDLLKVLLEVGATHWQIQLTVAMGNAVDNDHLLLQPFELLTLMPLLADLHQEALDKGLLIVVGNNIGYFGPYEHIFREHSDFNKHWSGCSAGQTVLGIEADGTIKGCPSLPTADYAGGNVRDLTLEQIWQFEDKINFRQSTSAHDLWGFCRGCYYADVCRGGCTWTSHSLLGRPGNNPYCHYRALELEKIGIRERVVKRTEAAKSPFATGSFELVQERVDAPVSDPDTSAREPQATVEEATRPITFIRNLDGKRTGPHESRSPGVVPEKLRLCYECDHFHFAHEAHCPFCGADTEMARLAGERDSKRREELMSALEKLLHQRVK